MLADQLPIWRRRRRLNQQELADRIKEDGGSLNRVAISKIETGDRSVSLDEWLQLSYALAVPPALLFLDLVGGDQVAIVPSAEVHPWLAWQWVAGDEPPATTNRRVKRSSEWVDAMKYVGIYDREQVAADAVHHAEGRISSAEYTGNPGSLAAAKERHVDALRDLAEVVDEMKELEMTPPAMPREWVELMRNLKMLKYPDAVEIFESPHEDDRDEE